MKTKSLHIFVLAIACIFLLSAFSVVALSTREDGRYSDDSTQENNTGERNSRPNDEGEYDANGQKTNDRQGTAGDDRWNRPGADDANTDPTRPTSDNDRNPGWETMSFDELREAAMNGGWQGLVGEDGKPLLDNNGQMFRPPQGGTSEQGAVIINNNFYLSDCTIVVGSDGTWQIKEKDQDRDWNEKKDWDRDGQKERPDEKKERPGGERDPTMEKIGAHKKIISELDKKIEVFKEKMGGRDITEEQRAKFREQMGELLEKRERHMLAIREILGEQRERPEREQDNPVAKKIREHEKIIDGLNGQVERLKVKLEERGLSEEERANIREHIGDLLEKRERHVVAIEEIQEYARERQREQLEREIEKRYREIERLEERLERLNGEGEGEFDEIEMLEHHIHEIQMFLEHMEMEGDEIRTLLEDETLSDRERAAYQERLEHIEEEVDAHLRLLDDLEFELAQLLSGEGEEEDPEDPEDPDDIELRIVELEVEFHEILMQLDQLEGHKGQIETILENPDLHEEYRHHYEERLGELNGQIEELSHFYHELEEELEDLLEQL